MALLAAALLWAGSACAPSAKPAAEWAAAESGRAAAAGDFERAVDIQQALYLRNPKDKKVAAGFTRTLEEVYQAAARLRAQEKYVSAAKVIRVLLDRWAGFAALAGKLSFKRADLEAGLRRCRVGLYEIQARQYMEAGEYEKAYSVFQAGLKDYPGDTALKAGYARAVEEVRAAGAKALAAGEYPLAGKLHALLLRNYDSFGGLGLSGAITKENLAEAVKACRAELTNQGLAEYRKGRLGKAISVWESLLAFDPDNPEIKKAVDTAKAQLGKIR